VCHRQTSAPDLISSTAPLCHTLIFAPLLSGAAADGVGQRPDLYAELGVNRDASSADLKRAYRVLALRLHPDKNPGDAAAAAQFQAVARAYNVLVDPAKRRYYDGGGPMEEMDVAADEWVASFAATMRDLTGGVPIKVRAPRCLL
jgi:DnaJ domain